MTVAAPSGAPPLVPAGAHEVSGSLAASRGFGALTRLGGAPRLAIGASVAVGVAAAAEFGGTDSGVSLCAVRHLTGGYCPGCGASRAARHLLHGDLSGAWADHPWVVFATAQLLIMVVTMAIVAGLARSGRGQGGSGRSWWRARRPLAMSVAVLNVVLLFGVWGVRVAAGDIPSPV